MLPVLYFILGIVLMIVGAEVLVRGASRLAVMAGVSPLVVGLTVVAFGTSSPEFAVSFKAALADQASICVGNVVGSNIFNILFILGTSAIVVPLVVSPQLVRFDLPLVIGVSLLSWLLALDGGYGRLDGSILFGGLLVYTLYSIYASRKSEKAAASNELASLVDEKPTRRLSIRLAINLALIIVGLVLLVVGANWLVDAAVTFARWFEVSELIIGLTIVSIGTSLPEVVTSLVASLKGERDIAVGNVVGSNLFNLLGVLGLAAIVAPSGLDVSDQVQQYDLPIMLAVAAFSLPIFFTGRIISRGEGLLLFVYYVLYTIFLILYATNDTRLELFGRIIVMAALPATFIGLCITSLRWAKHRKVLENL